MILPKCVNFILHPLVADIGRQAHAPAQILINSGIVDHVRAVHHHVTGLVIDHQTASTHTVSQDWQVFGHPAGIIHLAVIRTNPFVER